MLDLWPGPTCLGKWHCSLLLLGLGSGALELRSNEDFHNLRLPDALVTPFASHLKHVVLEPWPCVNLCALLTQEVPQLLPFNFFACFFGMIVGEASHPGPSHSLEGTPIKLVVSNPTAVHKKSDEVVALDADVVVFSETSATSVVQNEMTESLSKKGFRSFWSKPVPNKKITLDSRPSYRGEAIGTSIFTRIPSRLARVDIPSFLWDSCRLCCSIIKMHGVDVLLVSVYGFATRYQHGVRMNDVFLAALFDLVQRIDIPFIIAGDFNDPPHALPAFSLFSEIGAVEAFSYYKSSRSIDLPATCLGSTRNDTCIFHPWFVPFISQMHVDHDHRFDSHVPLTVFLDFHRVASPSYKWSIPRSWAALAPPKDIIDKFYNDKPFSHFYNLDDIVDESCTENALVAWSHAVELAVDRSISTSHKLNPVVYPWPSLHPSYKGKCKAKKALRKTDQNCIREDPTGAFNPATEVFSTKARQVVRQVRRLKSFRRALKAFSETGDPTRVEQQRIQIIREWSVILNAKGFGRRWASWILAFELIPFVLVSIPDIDILDLCIDVTEMHCNSLCRQEAAARRDTFRHRIKVDHDDGFLSLSYRILRGKSAPPLNEVPFEIESPASLVRSRKGDSFLRLDNMAEFRCNSVAKFGDATVKLLSQSGLDLKFSVVSGIVPAKGSLCQTCYAMTTCEIQDAFNAFWSKFWLRDDVPETQSGDPWRSFVTQMENVEFPQLPEINVRLDSVAIWMKAIRGLKNGKAHGIDGWRYDEIKKLPESCICDLAAILAKGARFGLSGPLMAAKTTLLAKVPDPQSLHHIRPITVLGVIYRLTGRVIFKQVVETWRHNMPLLISGGLPGRGVKDLAYLLKHRIELAIANKAQLGGFTLDLKKAFNTFPRWPIVFLWRKLGIPQWVCDFWLKSLMRMRRFPHLHGYLGSPVESTTGAPEGDSLSVLAMLALAMAFHWSIANETVTPHGYADNWGWSTFNFESHKRAFLSTIDFTSALRLQIDFSKSWHWSITKEFRTACLDLASLFPMGDIPIRVEAHVKDLGERFHYNKSIQLGNVKDKILEAENRAKRLKYIPLDPQTKASMIQASIWPMALYSADTAFLGMTHFQTLRAAALFALVGKCNFASPWLACFSVSKRLLDPLLFVLLSILRSLRRLMSLSKDDAMSIVHLACQFDGARPFGPGSTLKKYLSIIGWQIHPDASLTGPENFRINLMDDSSSRICSLFKQAWPLFLVSNLSRKGTGDFIPHHSLTSEVLSKFPSEEQALLVRNIVGGFQTAATQKIWDADTQIICQLCGLEDSRSHRCLECTHLADVRDRHPDALDILHFHRPDWVYIPLAHSSPDVVIQRAFLRTIKLDSDLPHVAASKKITFYTDGGAMYPTDPDARLASWSLVADPSDLSIKDIQVVSEHMGSSLHCPLLKVIGCGLVPGHQSAARGELVAFLQALRAAEKYEDHVAISIVTDASYVCFIDHLLRLSVPGFPNHKTRNGDIIQMIQSHWNPRIQVFKTKSHRKIEDTTDWLDLWTLYGNFAADFTASAALQRIPESVSAMFREIASFHKDEKVRLEKVFAYLVDLNRCRIEAIQQGISIVGQPDKPEVDTSGYIMPPKAMGTEARDFLASFNPSHYVQIFDEMSVDKNTFSGIIQGANFTAAVVSWLAQCRWPPDLQSDYNQKDDWGISWLELLFSFVLYSGMYPPVKTGGQKADAVFLNYCSPEALMLPASTRSASKTYYTFSQAILAIRTITEVSILPNFSSKKCSSLRHFSFTGTFAGLPCRPCLPNPAETSRAVFDYVSKLGGALTFHLPLTVLDAPLPFDQGTFTEISMRERHQCWQRIVTSRYKRGYKNRREQGHA